MSAGLRARAALSGGGGRLGCFRRGGCGGAPGEEGAELEQGQRHREAQMARGSRDCPASGRAAFGRGGRALLDSKRPRSGPRRGHVGMSPSTETRGRGDEPDTNPEREKKSARKPSPRDDRSGSPRAWGLYRDYCARLGRLDVGGNLPPWLTLYLLAWAGEKVQGNSSLAPRFPTGSPFSLSARSTLAPLKFRNMNRKGKGQGPPPCLRPSHPGVVDLDPEGGPQSRALLRYA